MTDTTEQVPWLQLFKPSSLDMVCGNSYITTYLKESMRDLSLSNCLLYGPPGIGKSSCLKCLPTAFSDNVMELNITEMNASDERRVQDVESRLKPFFFSMSHPFEIRLLLLDEVDNMTIPAQRLLADFLDREKRQFGSKKKLVLMACNEISKITPRLLAHLLPLHFKPVDPTSMIQHLELAMAKQNIFVLAQDAKEFWKIVCAKSSGDLRIAINLLQSCHIASKHESSNILTLKALERVCELPSAQKILNLLDLLSSGQLSNAILAADDLYNQGFQLLDILLLLQSSVQGLPLDNLLAVQIELLFASTILDFGRDCGTMLQLNACLCKLSELIANKVN